MDFPVTISIPVRYRDLDPMGHVNNAVYLSYLEAARVAFFVELAHSEGRPLPSQLDATGFDWIIAEITIAYKSPAYLGEELDVGLCIVSAGRTSFAIEYAIREQQSERLVATARSVQVMYDYSAGQKKAVPAEFLAAVQRLQGRAVSRT